MSKSKKNTIDPQNIIDQYGADAVRFFILADSPPERDIQWSEEGMLSSYKFIQKFWLLSEQIINLSKIKSDKQNEELEIEAHVILTGGFSKLISPKLSFEHNLESNLTLEGIRLIYEENK